MQTKCKASTRSAADVDEGAATTRGISYTTWYAQPIPYRAHNARATKRLARLAGLHHNMASRSRTVQT